MLTPPIGGIGSSIKDITRVDPDGKSKPNIFFDAGSKRNNSDVVSQPVHRYPDTKTNERASEGSNCVENVRYHNM